jgi:hypothetical protein
MRQTQLCPLEGAHTVDQAVVLRVLPEEILRRQQGKEGVHRPIGLHAPGLGTEAHRPVHPVPRRPDRIEGLEIEVVPDPHARRFGMVQAAEHPPVPPRRHRHRRRVEPHPQLALEKRHHPVHRPPLAPAPDHDRLAHAPIPEPLVRVFRHFHPRAQQGPRPFAPPDVDRLPRLRPGWSLGAHRQGHAPDFGDPPLQLRRGPALALRGRRLQHDPIRATAPLEQEVLDPPPRRERDGPVLLLALRQLHPRPQSEPPEPRRVHPHHDRRPPRPIRRPQNPVRHPLLRHLEPRRPHQRRHQRVGGLRPNPGHAVVVRPDLEQAEPFHEAPVAEREKTAGEPPGVPAFLDLHQQPVRARPKRHRHDVVVPFQPARPGHIQHFLAVPPDPRPVVAAHGQQAHPGTVRRDFPVSVRHHRVRLRHGQVEIHHVGPGTMRLPDNRTTRVPDLPPLHRPHPRLASLGGQPVGVQTGQPHGLQIRRRGRKHREGTTQQPIPQVHPGWLRGPHPIEVRPGDETEEQREKDPADRGRAAPTTRGASASLHGRETPASWATSEPAQAPRGAAAEGGRIHARSKVGSRRSLDGCCRAIRRSCPNTPRLVRRGDGGGSPALAQ